MQNRRNKLTALGRKRAVMNMSPRCSVEITGRRTFKLDSKRASACQSFMRGRAKDGLRLKIASPFIVIIITGATLIATPIFSVIVIIKFRIASFTNKKSVIIAVAAIGFFGNAGKNLVVSLKGDIAPCTLKKIFIPALFTIPAFTYSLCDLLNGNFCVAPLSTKISLAPAIIAKAVLIVFVGFLAARA